MNIEKNVEKRTMSLKVVDKNGKSKRYQLRGVTINGDAKSDTIGKLGMAVATAILPKTEGVNVREDTQLLFDGKLQPVVKKGGN